MTIEKIAILKRVYFLKTFLNVIVFLLILSVIFIAWMTVPIIMNPHGRSELTRLAANGKHLVQCIATNNVWPSAGELNPEEGTFDSSTSYFVWLVTNEIFNVQWRYFAGGGVPGAETEKEFAGKEDREEGYYNAWCIVGNIDENTPGDTPVLFIKKLGKDDHEEGGSFSKLNMKIISTQESFDRLFAGCPFKDENKFVFVCKDGSTFATFNEDMKLQNFTNIFVIPPEAENMPILRPSAADSKSSY